MGLFSLPENCHIVEATPPSVPGVATVTFDWISVKNYHKVYCVIHIHTNGATTCVLSFNRSPLVSGVGTAAMATACRIWSNQNTATNDLLVERTAAITYTTTASVNQLIVVEVDPVNLGDGYDCFSITSANFAANDVIAAQYYCVPRQASRVLTQPTGLTD